MSNADPDDNLMAWIADLRVRLDRGHLEMLAPLDVGHGTHALPDEHTIRVMLADLDSFEDMTPDEANDPVNVTRRASLLADFRALQFLIN